MYFFAALKTKPSEQDIARSLCASIKALPRDPLAARIRVAIACRLQAGNAAASFEAVNNACKFASTKAKSAASRALQIKSSDDNGRRKRPPAPLRRRELRARSAARRPVPRYRWRQLSPTTPGLRAIAATLASESRPRLYRCVEARSLTHRRDQTTQQRRHGHGRPQQVLQLPLSGVEEHAPAGY